MRKRRTTEMLKFSTVFIILCFLFLFFLAADRLAKFLFRTEVFRFRARAQHVSRWRPLSGFLAPQRLLGCVLGGLFGRFWDILKASWSARRSHEGFLEVLARRIWVFHRFQDALAAQLVREKRRHVHELKPWRGWGGRGA